MNKKIVVSLIALAVFIGGIAFVVTRNNDGGADEAAAVVQELPELTTQEIDKVETAEAIAEIEEEPEIIEEDTEEVEEIVAESDGVSEEEEEAEEEAAEVEGESIVAVENTEVKDAESEQKKEEVIAEVKKDVPDANIVDSSPKDTSANQAALIQKAESFGFAVGGFDIEGSHAGTSTYETGAVWE